MLKLLFVGALLIFRFVTAGCSHPCWPSEASVFGIGLVPSGLNFCSERGFGFRICGCVVSSPSFASVKPSVDVVFVHRVAVRSTTERADIVHRAMPERGSGLCRPLAGLGCLPQRSVLPELCIGPSCLGDNVSQHLIGCGASVVCCLCFLDEAVHLLRVSCASVFLRALLAMCSLRVAVCGSRVRSVVV